MPRQVTLKRGTIGPQAEQKRQRTIPFEARVGHCGHIVTVAFHYQGKTAEVALETLKAGSEYFASFFSDRYREKASPPQVVRLERPEDKNFSPKLFIQLLQAGKKEWKQSDWRRLPNLIDYYQMKEPLKEQILASIDLDNIDEVIKAYDVLAPHFASNTLAIHCLQILVDDKDFIDVCLLKDNRKFLSDHICKRIDFFNRLAKEVTRLQLGLPVNRTNSECLYIATAIDPKRLILLSNLFGQVEHIEVTLPKELLVEWTEHFVRADTNQTTVFYDYFNPLKNATDEECRTLYELNCAFGRLFLDNRSPKLKSLTIGNPVIYLWPHIIKRFKNREGDFVLEFCSNTPVFSIYRPNGAQLNKPHQFFSEHDFFPEDEEEANHEYEEENKAEFFKVIPFPIPPYLQDIDPERLPWTKEGTLRKEWNSAPPPPSSKKN